MIKIVILCGGKGTRLRPLTELVPKSLVSLNGKPCLQHLVEVYIGKGYRQFVLCIGYRGEMIVDFFQRNTFEAEFKFSDAGEGASILQRLYQARGLIGERAFVAYGDTLIDLDLGDMLAAHLSSKAAITLTTADVRSPFGLVTMDRDKRVLSFEEKPVQPYYVGHMLIERSILDQVPPDLLELPDGDGLVLLFKRLAAQGRVRVYPYSGPQITFNTQRDLDEAERDFVAFFTHVERESR